MVVRGNLNPIDPARDAQTGPPATPANIRSTPCQMTTPTRAKVIGDALGLAGRG